MRKFGSSLSSPTEPSLEPIREERNDDAKEEEEEGKVLTAPPPPPPDPSDEEMQTMERAIMSRIQGIVTQVVQVSIFDRNQQEQQHQDRGQQERQQNSQSTGSGSTDTHGSTAASSKQAEK